MGDDQTVNALIDEIYSFALSAEDPTPLYGRLAACLGYETAGLVTARSRYSHATCNVSYGVDLALCKRAEQEFGMSMTMSRIQGRELRTGEFAFREELISDAELRKQRFYHEFLLPQRMHDGVKICLENSPDRLIFLGFARAMPGVERERQRQILATLAPHWVRATQVFLKLGQVDQQRRALEVWANMTPLPIVVFDCAAALYFANQRAQSLTGDGLRLAEDRLHASLDAEHQRLRLLIRQVVASSSAVQGHLAGADITITRPSGRRPYQLVLMPLSPAHYRDWRRPAAMVLVFEPDAEPNVKLKRCQEVFGFTRAEAQVALGVMRGMSMEQIAATIGNSVSTSRNLLKRVFLKTGVNRQSELTRLMLGSPIFVDIGSHATAPEPYTR